MTHQFKGKWISDAELAALQPRNVFHRQLEPLQLDCSEHRNAHVLFRKRFTLDKPIGNARIFITADDYYMLYVNGTFVAQGPAPSYHFQYNYNEIDLTLYLVKGENVIAVHTLYQGLVNRVWQSGDHRHGLLCDTLVDGVCVACSDESFWSRCTRDIPRAARAAIRRSFSKPTIAAPARQALSTPILTIAIGQMQASVHMTIT